MKLLKKIFHSTRRILAKHWLRRMNVVQIAITGSQGKTAVSQGLHSMLSTLRPTVITDVNLDTIYNVPITALSTRPYHHYAIFELGIDKIGEMAFHLQIVKPNICVVTGVSSVHSDDDHMKSFANVIQEKSILVKNTAKSGTAILNFSDKHVRGMSKLTDANILWYGQKDDFAGASETNFVAFSNIKVTTEGTTFDLYDAQANERISINTKLIGTFHAGNICAIYCVLKTLNPYFVQNFALGVSEHLSPLKGRMNIENFGEHSIVLNDSLRANPISTKAGLETFAQISYPKGRKVVVMADMGELEKPEEEHKKIGKLLTTLPIDVVVCAGKMQKFVAMEAARSKNLEVHYFDTVKDAKNEIAQILRPSDFIYLKGSLYSKVGEIFK